jgi:hypothetical protein
MRKREKVVWAVVFLALVVLVHGGDEARKAAGAVAVAALAVLMRKRVSE